MAKDESSSSADRERSRKSSKSATSNSNNSNVPQKKPNTNAPTMGSGDRLRPPVSTTSSLARKMDEARLEKKRELLAAAKASVDFEETDANAREPKDDLETFVQCCEVIRDSLGKMRVAANLDHVSD